MLVKDNKQILSVDQLTVAKQVATQLGLDLKSVISVIEAEQKTTMSYVKRGYKVVKKNYITIKSYSKNAYSFVSGIDGKKYKVPERLSIRITPGEGFKTYLNSEIKQMPEKLCRFVDKK